MYIRKSTRSYKSRTYTNYLLVESVHTPKGPRQRTVCSLGDLSPRPREEWLKGCAVAEIGWRVDRGRSDAGYDRAPPGSRPSPRRSPVLASSGARRYQSPLAERPIFHHTERRTEAHIFLCVLAYHLLIAIEKTLLDQAIHTSWATVRDTLKTHQVCTIVLPTADGSCLRVRKAATAEPDVQDLYRRLAVSPQIIKPQHSWTAAPA
jgi:hypothetical protein